MKHIIIFMFAVSATSGLVSGQTLDESLVLAAENNAGLRADLNEYLAAMETIPQVGALPDPELTVGIFLKPMERFMGTQQADIQLMQMFPWFGMLRSSKDEAAKMARARYEVFRDNKNSLYYQVKSVWYELYRLNEEVSITEENLGILQTFERLALIRFQSAGVSGSGGVQEKKAMNEAPASSGTGMGNMSGSKSPQQTELAPGGNSVMGTSGGMSSGGSGMSDVLRVRMQIRELESKLALLRDSKAPLQAEFNQLLSRDIDAPVSISDTLAEPVDSIDRQALLDSITRNNPMLKMLDAEEQAYVARQKMARLEGRPMIGVGLTYMPFTSRLEHGEAMGGDDMFMPMVKVTLPIYRKKYTALSRESELRQKAVQQRRDDTARQLAVQWSSALRSLDDASRRIELYKGQSDLARQTLRLLLTSYSANGQDFEEVLSLQQQLLDYRLQLVTAVVDKYTTLAKIENLASVALD